MMLNFPTNILNNFIPTQPSLSVAENRTETTAEITDYTYNSNLPVRLVVLIWEKTWMCVTEETATYLYPTILNSFEGSIAKRTPDGFPCLSNSNLPNPKKLGEEQPTQNLKMMHMIWYNHRNKKKLISVQTVLPIVAKCKPKFAYLSGHHDQNLFQSLLSKVFKCSKEKSSQYNIVGALDSSQSLSQETYLLKKQLIIVYKIRTPRAFLDQLFRQIIRQLEENQRSEE